MRPGQETPDEVRPNVGSLDVLPVASMRPGQETPDEAQREYAEKAAARKLQ